MSTDGVPKERHMETIRVAAAGDIHCRESHRDDIVRAFGDLPGTADLVLLAGDLTTCGDPDEAAILGEACRSLQMPIVAVLGNHDWHSGRGDEIAGILEAAGIEVLERSFTTHEVRGHEVGIVA